MCCVIVVVCLGEFGLSCWFCFYLICIVILFGWIAALLVCACRSVPAWIVLLNVVRSCATL